jgi:uncharacterized protein YnzC (UPF0291/DUF896 family)
MLHSYESYIGRRKLAPKKKFETLTKKEKKERGYGLSGRETAKQSGGPEF